MPKVALLLGSNLNDRYTTMEQAAWMIESWVGKTESASSYYESEPWNFNSDNLFLNRALVVDTQLAPLELLDELQTVEKELGRVEKGHFKVEKTGNCAESSRGYKDRTIDIDIIFYDDMVFSSERLTIPHPQVQHRLFALNPLAEIIPSYVHPMLGVTVRELLEVLIPATKPL